MIPSDTPLRMPNCGVIAVAVVAGTTYREAEDLFRTRFNKRANWRGKTQATQRTRVLEILGLTVVRQYARPRTTMRLWLDTYYDPDKTYELTVTGHAVAIKDGMLFDQQFTHGVDPRKSTYLRKYVRSWIEVYN